MDDQLNNQNTVEEAALPESTADPINSEIISQPPEPVINPEPQISETEIQPSPESQPTPEPESTAISSEYQQILNQYAANQPQPPVIEETPEPSQSEPNMTPTPQPTPNNFGINPPNPNNIFKTIFIIALVIFILVFSVLVFAYVKNQQNKAQINSDSSNTIQTSPTPVPTTTCSLNDKTYNAGDTFPSADGCNSCSCAENGAIACTVKACDITPVATKSATTVATKSANLTPTKSASTSSKTK
jgi:hypothetical protein